MSDDSAPFAESELDTAPPVGEVVTATPALVLEGLTKRYGATRALLDFTFTPTPGAIHVILGDHQAGKSTLLHLLSGFTAPDNGEIRWFGRSVALETPADALALGIGIVHRRPTLVPALSVGENIILGTPDDGFSPAHRGPFAKIRAIAGEYGLGVDPAARPRTLSPTEALHAEFLRLLYRNLDVLLLDEPFTRLHPDAHDAFRDTLRRLAGEGKTILCTTTNPAHARAAGDLILLLREGRLLQIVSADATGTGALYRDMTGHTPLPALEHSAPSPGAVVLSTRHLAALPDLVDITLDVRRGEILAVVGLPFSGQEMLAELLVGARPPGRGRLFVGSEEIEQPGAVDAARLGIAYLPPLGDESTLAPAMTVAENLALRSFAELSRGLFLSDSQLASHARRVLRAYHLNVTPETKVRDLTPSGKHALLLARALSDPYQVLVALFPTRGVPDEDARQIHRHLLAERESGKAILLLTDDTGETLALGDRIAVLREGRLVATVERAGATPATLAALVAGRDSAATP